MAQRNIHLTLAFLGDVEERRRGDVEAVAAGIRGDACELRLDRIGYWRHNRIVWAGGARCPDALSVLAAQLSDALRGAGFRVDRRPYVPHVTLLRNARAAPSGSAMPPVELQVRELALVNSVARDGGRRYEVQKRWPLAT